MEEDKNNWVEAMTQQTKSDVIAEAVRLRRTGMDEETAGKVANRRVVMGLQVRSRLISAVMEATHREKYATMSDEEKTKVLKEVLDVEASVIRKEMLDPVERIIVESHNTVSFNLISRIEEALHADRQTDDGDAQEDAGAGVEASGSDEEVP